MTATQPKLLSLSALKKAASCLRVLAHPHRLRIVQLLLHEKVSVSQLAQACRIPQPLASEHLRLMDRCGFLRAEREGKFVYYTIAESHLRPILACIEDRFG